MIPVEFNAMIKFFFATQFETPLAEQESSTFTQVKGLILLEPDVVETRDPYEADAIILKEINSFKNFNYVNTLLRDPFISKFAHNVYTINDDDCATGLLKGLYTSLPKSRFNTQLHVAVPYMNFPNEQVYKSEASGGEPSFLASWRGNTKSNPLRKRILKNFKKEQQFLIEETNSWLNHDDAEKTTYVNLIKSSKFSLCPAGWAPVSFRIYESMALSRCPVVIADNFVPPEGPNWHEFALFFPEKRLSELPNFLLRKESSYLKLGQRAYEEWLKHFSPEKIGFYYANAVLALIKGAPKLKLQDEIQRWNSLEIQWQNRWTIPQRILNKARRMIVSQQT